MKHHYQYCSTIFATHFSMWKAYLPYKISYFNQPLASQNPVYIWIYLFFKYRNFNSWPGQVDYWAKELMIKSWRPEFYPLNQGKVEQTPQKCHLTAICMLWHLPPNTYHRYGWTDTYAHSYTCTHTNEKLKEIQTLRCESQFRKGI